ncbi:hypothetical protein Hanom_Chr05g00430281 [Helianthus anomalus]
MLLDSLTQGGGVFLFLFNIFITSMLIKMFFHSCLSVLETACTFYLYPFLDCIPVLRILETFYIKIVLPNEEIRKKTECY